jgi:hypothetical protein
MRRRLHLAASLIGGPAVLYRRKALG